MLFCFFGGPEEIRTLDPHNANVMRSQLRYRPKSIIYYTQALRKSKVLFVKNFARYKPVSLCETILIMIRRAVMLVPFFRTMILYLAIILAVRLMGKRQVGEMQPAELVITILVSAVASVPMQDLDIPLAHGLIPVFTLIAAEVLVSALSMKWPGLRRLLSGKPVPVIREGSIDQQALRRLRLSTDDLLEDLRLNGVFDLRQVAFGQIETNGQLSVLLQAADAPVTPRQMGLAPARSGPFYVLISDGKTDLQALEFVVLELGTYLDTHPDDKEALELYRTYQKMYHDAMMEYSEQCDPLNHVTPVKHGKYTWIDEPWPWEYAANKEG